MPPGLLQLFLSAILPHNEAELLWYQYGTATATAVVGDDHC